jgi:hypothetical protein
MAKSTSKLFKEEEPKPMQEDAMNLPEEVNEMLPQETIPAEQSEVVDTPAPSNDDIQDIDLSAIKKKRFRINGDPNKILELNTSDLSITSRLSKSYEKLNKYMDEVGKELQAVPDSGEEELSEDQERLVEENLAKIDAKMREEIDYIFDAPVSEVCADEGSMYDPFNGMFRFEHIIDAITKLYENNLNSEFNKMKRRVSAKTSKYTKHYHN